MYYHHHEQQQQIELNVSDILSITPLISLLHQGWKIFR